jgi:hypothetical protein
MEVIEVVICGGERDEVKDRTLRGPFKDSGLLTSDLPSLPPSLLLMLESTAAHASRGLMVLPKSK